MASPAQAYARIAKRLPAKSAPRRTPGPSRRQAGLQRQRARRLQTFALCALPIAFLLAYVELTAELTAQTYQLAAERSRQNELLQTNEELRQRMQVLQSMPRLERVAVQLHMAEPQSIAVITPSPVASPRSKAAIAIRLSTLKRWLAVR